MYDFAELLFYYHIIIYFYCSVFEFISLVKKNVRYMFKMFRKDVQNLNLKMFKI